MSSGAIAHLLPAISASNCSAARRPMASRGVRMLLRRGTVQSEPGRSLETEHGDLFRHLDPTAQGLQQRALGQVVAAEEHPVDLRLAGQQLHEEFAAEGH